VTAALLVAAAKAATGVGVLILWLVWLRASLGWFAAGAAIWFAGAIVLKGAAAAALPAVHEPWQRALSSFFLTGLCEPGVTLAAGLVFGALAKEPRRMTAVGLGAGAGEALFLGALGVLLVAAALVGKRPMPAEAPYPAVAAAVAVYERSTGALVHAAARLLTLLSLPTRRPALFFGAFVLMGAVDALAGFTKTGGASIGWVELALLPAGVVGALVLRWGTRLPTSLSDAAWSTKSST